MPDIRAEVLRRGMVAEISDATIWRWLSADAIAPWRHRLARYRRDRDAGQLAAAMVRLDAEESRARAATAGAPLEATEVVAYLRDLPALWDAAPSSRRALAESLFDGVDVLGLRSMAITPSPAAIARKLAEAFRSGGDGYGRGERI